MQSPVDLSVPPVAEIELRSASLKAAHDDVLLDLIPMIDDAAFDLVMSTEEVSRDSTSSIRKLIDVGANLLHVVLNVRSAGILASGILSEAAGIKEESLLLPLEERFEAAALELERLFSELPESADSQRIKQLSSNILDFGRGDDGIFMLRREELQQFSKSEVALIESRRLAVEFGDAVAGLVETASFQSDTSASASEKAIRTGKILIFVFTVSSVIGALIVVLTFILSTILFSDKMAIVAALLVSLSPHMIAMNAFVLSETLFTFLLILAVTLLVFGHHLEIWFFFVCQEYLQGLQCLQSR